jgi:hypothetical protein
MKSVSWILSSFLAATIAVSLPCNAAVQEGSSGIVEKIRGTVFWKQNSNAKAIQLDAKLDAARRLYSGEQVRCAQRSMIRICLRGEVRKIHGPSSWFTLPKASSSRLDARRRALDEYGNLAGRSRTASARVFSPSDHSAVTPEMFVIRWNPGSVARTVSFIITQARGNEVWRRDQADGGSGFFTCNSAKQALRKYRAEFGQGPLVLKLIDSYGKETTTFSLLSIQSELSLKQQLAFWNRKPRGLMSRLGRASLFIRYRMYPKAAEEYEAALSAAPESRELLIRTILAHRDTGNFARKEELERRLPAGTKPP